MNHKDKQKLQTRFSDIIKFDSANIQTRWSKYSTKSNYEDDILFIFHSKKLINLNNLIKQNQSMKVSRSLIFSSLDETALSLEEIHLNNHFINLSTVSLFVLLTKLKQIILTNQPLTRFIQKLQKDTKIMQKTLFQCKNCHYFLAQVEIQIYFSTTHIFHCPVCNYHTLFDSQKCFLLKSQYFFIQTTFSDPSHKNLQGKNNHQLSFKNQYSQKVQRVYIIIQTGEWLFQHMYFNPLNPQLQKNSNVRKQDVLSLKKMIFFCLNDQILRQLSLTNKKNQNNGSYFWRLPKYGLRKVSRIEHMLYFLDLYIQNLNQILDEKSDLQISLQIAQKSWNQNSTISNGTQQQFLGQLRFKINGYKQLQSHFFNGEKQSLNQHKNGSVGHFQQQVLKFLKIFYSKNQTQKQQKRQVNVLDSGCSTTTNQNSQKNQIKIITLLSQTVNYQRAKSFVQEKMSKTYNVGRVVHNLFFQNTDSTNSQPSQLFTAVTDLIQTPLSNHFNLFSCCIYSKFTDQLAPLDLIVHKIIDVSKQQIKKQLSTFNGQNTKSISDKDSIQSQLNLDTIIQGPKFQPKQQSYKALPFETFVLLFFKPTNSLLNNQSPNKIKTIKIKASENLCQKFTEASSTLQSQKQNQTLFESIQKQLMEILQSHNQFLTQPQSIQIDRLCVQQENHRLYYIYDYDKICRQNYEELDFLDQHSLPEQLKGYSSTYKRDQQKYQNPFKKLTHRVCLVKKEPETLEDDYFSEQDHQTL